MPPSLHFTCFVLCLANSWPHPKCIELLYYNIFPIQYTNNTLDLISIDKPTTKLFVMLKQMTKPRAIANTRRICLTLRSISLFRLTIIILHTSCLLIIACYQRDLHRWYVQRHTINAIFSCSGFKIYWECVFVTFQ